MKKTSITFITGPGIHTDMDHPLPYVSPVATEAHYLIASIELHHAVTVITTCTDDFHEQAGSSHVVHITPESDEAQLQHCREILAASDVVVCQNCFRTKEPVRSILSGVRPDSRLYSAYFNDGENRFPRLENLTDAFKMSVRAAPAEAICDIIRHLHEFPVKTE